MYPSGIIERSGGNILENNDKDLEGSTYKGQRIRKIKNNKKDWRYYILECPIDTYVKMSMMAPWGKSRPTRRQREQWERYLKENPRPPVHIQILLTFIMYIITSGGLFVLGLIFGSMLPVIANLMFFTMIIFMFAIFNFTLKFIDFATKHTSQPKKEMSQLSKFLYINFIYIIITYGFFSLCAISRGLNLYNQ